MTPKTPAQEALEWIGNYEDSASQGCTIYPENTHIPAIRRALKILDAIEGGELVDVLNYQDFYSDLELLKAIERAKGNNDLLAKLKEIGEEK